MAGAKFEEDGLLKNEEIRCTDDDLLLRYSFYRYFRLLLSLLDQPGFEF
jgi:hypothetical protein